MAKNDVGPLTPEDRIKKLEDQAVLFESRIAELEKPKVVAPTFATPTETSAYPIPSEYRQIVNDVLNQDFAIQIVPLSDYPSFQFNIIVPDKYSPMTPDQRAGVGGDIRGKVITYAENLNGVKLWTEKVASSFYPDTRALILADKHHA